jgi:hypothetical protein
MPGDNNGIEVECHREYQAANEQKPLGIMDLARLCAAPLITYCAAKEMNHEHSQDGRIS